MARPHPVRIVGQAAGALGGVLLIVASSVSWSARGAGSTLPLSRIGDLILSGTIDAWVPRSAGLAVYALPLGGALLLVGAGLGGRGGAGVSALAVVLATGGAILVTTALDRIGRRGLGPGLVLAGAGIALGVLATALGTAAKGQPGPSIPTPPER